MPLLLRCLIGQYGRQSRPGTALQGSGQPAAGRHPFQMEDSRRSTATFTLPPEATSARRLASRS